jgi:hypothetical protein
MRVFARGKLREDGPTDIPRGRNASQKDGFGSSFVG